MAVKGIFLMATFFALLLTTVRALKCYEELKYECDPKSICTDDTFGNQTDKNSTECASNVTMCTSTNISGKGKTNSFKLEAAGCAPKEEKQSKCYEGKNELKRLNPEMATKLETFVTANNITATEVEVCICDGELCNSSVKSAVSISVMISSAVISFMLFT